MGFHNPRMPWSQLESTLSGDQSGKRSKKKRPDGPSWGGQGAGGQSAGGRGGKGGWPSGEPTVVDPLAGVGDGGDSPAWSRKREPYTPPALVKTATTTEYAELHCHSNFSFLDGASHPEELA